MKTVVGDIWDYKDTHWIVVPTNLQGAMGKGLAYQAKERYPGLEDSWKTCCGDGGEAKILFLSWCKLILFPVKYRWRDKADLDLIEQSLRALSGWLELTAIPQIGCGFGERDWFEEVEPLVKKYLGNKDNFMLVLPSDIVRFKYPKAFLPGVTRFDKGSKR